MELTFDLEKNEGKVNELKKFIKEHQDMPGKLMPILQEAQEIFGYLPEEIMKLIAEEADIPASNVFGVATYYSQFTFSPKGEYAISACTGTACYVRGAGDIVDKIKEILKIDVGETTKDGQFTLDECRCIGACGLAPVITINDEVYGRLSKDDIPGILENCKNTSKEA